MVVVVLVVCPWCWCGCGELMAEAQRGTTLQCMAVCVRPEHGWCVVGWWALCHHHQRQHHAVDGFVAMTAPHSPAVSHQHTDACVCVVCGRVCCGVCAWWCRFGKCVLLSTTVTWCALLPLGGCTTTAAAFCCWCFFVGRASWASCTTRVFVCVERFDFGNKQAHKHTTCGNTTRVGAPGQLATQPATSALVPSPR